MAHVSGKTGAIYISPKYTAITIAAVDSTPDTFTDSASGFVTAGFTASDLITVSGFTTPANNDTFEVDTVVAGTLTLAAGETLTAEIAGDTVTIVVATPGLQAQVAGFKDWSLNYEGAALETTDFADIGIRTYIAGITGWSATANEYWDAGSLHNDWIGTIKRIRFFMLYNASPNVTTAYYYEGDAVITVSGPAVAVDGIVTQAMSFQGTGALTFITQSIAWPVHDA